MTARLRVAAAFVLLTSPLAVASAQHELVALPLGDPAYVQLDALARMGCQASDVSSFRPHTIVAIRRALTSAVRERECRGAILSTLVARFKPDTADRSALPAPGELPITGPVSLEAVAAMSEDDETSSLTFGAEATARVSALNNGEFRPLWQNVRPTAEGDPSLVGLVRARVTWEASPKLIAVSEVYAQSDRRNDPLIRGRGFRSTSGVFDFSEAYLTGRFGRLMLSFGRAREAWLGGAEESLVLSAHGPPLDRLLASARWSRFEIRALVASVNDVVLDEPRDSLLAGIPPQRLHRMFVAHALSFRPSSGWEITIGETGVLTRRGGGFDLAYANPLMLFLVTENDTSRAGGAFSNNNLTAFGATRVRLGRARLTGELLIDDIQIDSKDRAVTPDQLGWRLEGVIPIQIAARLASLGLEYRRLDGYTYMRRSYAEVYQQYDRPLGSELGPDADLMRGFAELWSGGRVRFGGTVSRWRRGDKRIDQRPGRSAFGRAGDPFPTVSTERPVTQRAWLGEVSFDYLDAVLPVSVAAELARIDNANHRSAEAGNYVRAHFVLTYRFRYP